MFVYTGRRGTRLMFGDEEVVLNGPFYVSVKTLIASDAPVGVHEFKIQSQGPVDLTNRAQSQITQSDLLVNLGMSVVKGLLTGPKRN